MQEIVSKYIPQPHQSPFHASLAVEKLFLAGVGAGKTLTGVHESVFLAQDNPKCDGCITAPTYPMLRDVIIPLWEEWIPPQLYTWKKADQCFIWHPTGRKIFLRSSDRPGRISGLNLGWAWLDEAAQLIKPDVWNILRARIRDPKAQRRCLFATTTPLGLNWLIREFRKPGGVPKFVKRSRTADNVHLTADFEPGLRAAFGAEYAAMYLDALVLELSGLAYPYSARIHSAFRLGDVRPRIRHFFGGADWGLVNPACLLVGGVDYDGRWYLVDIWYRRGKLREQIAKEAKRLQAKWGIKKWYADHDPEGIRHMKAEGCSVDLAEKDVVQGVQFCRSLFLPRSDGQPRVYVLETLTDWLREVDGYYFPEDEEVPEGQFGDHAMDAFRYMTYSHSLLWVPFAYQTVDRGRMGHESTKSSRYH